MHKLIPNLGHVGVGNFEVADMHRERSTELANQGLELLEQVGAEEGRPGDGGGVYARFLQLGPGAGGRIANGAGRMPRHVQPRIPKMTALRRGRTDASLGVAAERIAQGATGMVVAEFETRDDLFGSELLRRREVVHSLSSPRRKLVPVG
jgi:hypothetical protein